MELIKRLDRSSMELLVACFDREGPLAEELAGYLDDIHAFPLKGFLNAPAARRISRRWLLITSQRT